MLRRGLRELGLRWLVQRQPRCRVCLAGAETRLSARQLRATGLIRVALLSSQVHRDRVARLHRLASDAEEHRLGVGRDRGFLRREGQLGQG